MERVPLPNDQWADIRSLDEITVRGRGLIARTGSLQAVAMVKMFRLIELDEDREAAKARGDANALQATAEDILANSLTEEEMRLADDYQHACVVAFVAAWSYPDPPTMESVQDLPIVAYDALQAKIGPLALELAGVIPHVTPDDVMDPASPTEPSSGSGTAWRDEKSPSQTTPEPEGSTGTLTSDGENSATGGPSGA